MPALICAFDGVLSLSLPLRAHAVREACVAEGLTVSASLVDALVPGRTFSEAAAQLAAGHDDPVVAELIALRAQRLFGALVAQGVPWHPEAVLALRAQAGRGTRLVVRADSERRHVEPLLTLAGLDALVHLVRCSDDPPRGGDPSLVRSWAAIDARLARLGIPAAERTAWEPTDVTAAAAAPYVGHASIGTG